MTASEAIQETDEELSQQERIFKWLSFCLQRLNEGQEEEIPRNPFYRSVRGVLTDDYVNRMIAEIDGYMARELARSPNYHLRDQGTTRPPEYRRMGSYARRAMVEKLDQIMGFQRPPI